MRLLRSVLFLLYMSLLTPVYAITCLLVFVLLNAHQRWSMVRVWCRLSINGARALCGIRYRVIGEENLPDRPVVVLVKHQSAWETIAIPALLRGPQCYVFKRSLLYIPFFGWTLGLLKMIHIDRKQGPRAFASVIRQGKERIADGSSVVMFPEGTRTPTGVTGVYKSGGARFALATNADVVPIAHNAGRVWPRNTLVKHPGLVTISIGPVIRTAGRTTDDVNNEVAGWIEAEMRRIDASAYASEKVTGASAAIDTASATAAPAASTATVSPAAQQDAASRVSPSAGNPPVDATS
ncbi:lysophospholipid acyltransferase family protein [Robbsia andropogonis]|uniref:lysophospholipid acyltransferase family protein n=1 Tax=Robbsia andropogonis TaxID=28092 RepID=UPI0009E2BBFF|nr:lysophospholipid acyltransferase family protein [Robbsia andropogonis]